MSLDGKELGNILGNADGGRRIRFDYDSRMLQIGAVLKHSVSVAPSGFYGTDIE